MKNNTYANGLLLAVAWLLAAAPGMAQTVLNPSFEEGVDAFATFPGYVTQNGPIPQWDAAGGHGVNPGKRADGSTFSPFADNGQIPDGTHVAFMQADGTLSQQVSGFTVGKRYAVQYFENARAAGGKFPGLAVKVGDNTVVAEHLIPPIGGTNAYRKVISSDFVAADTALKLEFIKSAPQGGDTTALVDNVSVFELTQPFVKSVRPSGVGVAPNAALIVELEDLNTQVNPNSIQLTLNGAATKPAITKTGLITTVRFNPADLFPSGSTNSFSLTVADNRSSPQTNTFQFNFLVADVGLIPTLPPNFAAKPSAVDTSSSGFKVRVHQARFDAVLTNSIARAEAQLAGTLIDPNTSTPFMNEANPKAAPGAAADGTFPMTLINWSSEAGGLGPERGNFQAPDFPDTPIPGIDQSGINFNNIAAEVITFLDLAPGTYTFGVNSDDGFRLTSGANPRDALATQLGIFDSGRGSADTLFTFRVTQAGIYPFRLVWFQGTGPASLEWFSVNPDGAKVLINDRKNPEHINAFSKFVGMATPFVKNVQPLPGTLNVPSDASVQIELQDADTKVNSNSIRMTLNSQATSSSVTKSGNVTTVSLKPLITGETNAVTLVFSDDGSPVTTVTNSWQFTVTSGVSVPELLFQDNFNVSANSADINFENDRGRQNGSALGFLSYAERADTKAGGTNDMLTQLNTPDAPGQLVLTVDSFVWTSPNHNFTDGGNFTIEFDVTPSPRPEDNWAAIVFGATRQGPFVNASDGVGILFRGSGGYSIFEEGVNAMNGGGVTSPTKVRLAVKTADFQGSPATYSFFINDTLIVTRTKASGFKGDFVTLEGFKAPGSEVIHTFDNLKISADVGVRAEPSAVSAMVGDTNHVVTITIPSLLNATNAATVTITSLNPAVAVPAGATGGALKLTFPKGGSITQSVNVVALGPGQTAFKISNSHGISVPRNLSVTVTQPVAPRLSAQRTADNSIRLSWPATAQGFVLQSADMLSGPWTDVTLQAATEGDQVVVTSKVTGVSKFFRLLKK